jgi:predicted dienelactone hydrolase
MRNFQILLIVFFMFFSVESLYGDQRNYNVGLRHVETLFQPENVKIHMMVWYPSSEQAKKNKVGPFEVYVARNSKVEPGKRDLLLISHGDGGSHLLHRDTALYLAKKGFIVVTILHPHNNYADNSAEGTHQNWVNRPIHISKAIDTLLTHHEFKNVINNKNIAIVGFSAGAYTALSLIGGVADTSNVRAHCEKHPDDSRFCRNYGLSSKNQIELPSKKKNNNTVIKNSHDKRIKAAVLMAPVGVLFIDRKSLSNVKVPVRIYRAEKDKILHFPYHAEFIKDNLPTLPEYIVVKNAGHHSFISPIPERMKSQLGEIAIDPKGFDRKKFHLKMNQEIANFLSRALHNSNY